MMFDSMIVVAVVVGLFGILGFYISKLLSKPVANGADAKEVDQDSTKVSKTEKKETVASKKKRHEKAGSSKDTFDHEWLVTTLKGHSGNVLDMDLSENGKYLASCSSDRSVLIWLTKEFPQKEHKVHRSNVNYGMASKIKWSPDSRAYIIHKDSENCTEVYKIHKREDGGHLGSIQPILTFPSKHDTDVIGIGFAPTGKFIMSCSDKTTLILWNIKGEVLATVDTYQMNTYCAKVSPCGRYVATSGFTPDVKVWEVKFSRTGEFEKIHRAFELTGHASGVFHFDFSPDSSKMVTLGKDGYWRFYQTNVEFERGQDPSCLQKGSFPEASVECVIALSNDATIVTLSKGSSIHWFSTSTCDKLGLIESVHNSPITSLLFDREGKWLISSGDKHIRVFTNVPGYKVKLRDLQSKLKQANNEGMRERLKQQIAEIESILV